MRARYTALGHTIVHIAVNREKEPCAAFTKYRERERNPSTFIYLFCFSVCVRKMLSCFIQLLLLFIAQKKEFQLDLEFEFMCVTEKKFDQWQFDKYESKIDAFVL